MFDAVGGARGLRRLNPRYPKTQWRRIKLTPMDGPKRLTLVTEGLMKCEFLLTYRSELKPAVEVGGGPFGTRLFFAVIGGTFEGPRLKGKILTGGGDWLLMDPQNVARLDVRATFETDDGARIYVQYPG